MIRVRAEAGKSINSAMENKLKLGIYEHYKGNRYEAIGVAKHSETLEELVVYKALYGDGQIWIRPLKMFMEEVEVDGKMVPRFKPMERS
jgi:cyclomaltodextrinase